MINELEDTLIHCVTGEENIQAIKDIFTIFKHKTNGGVTIELEDYNGNTIGGIKINGCVFNHKTEEIGELSVADFEGDYIFDTKYDLVRIQLNGNIKSKNEMINEEWKRLNEEINGMTWLFENEQDLVMITYGKKEPYFMDKEEIIKMLINNCIEDYYFLAENCIRFEFNNCSHYYYLIYPINASKENRKDFEEIKKLLG